VCVCSLLFARSGVSIKTRKRNIVIPKDEGSFADALIQVVQDAQDSGSKGLNEDLAAVSKALDSAELDYQRYGDTLFEVRQSRLWEWVLGHGDFSKWQLGNGMHVFNRMAK
jgi:hypothetical protein